MWILLHPSWVTLRLLGQKINTKYFWIDECRRISSRLLFFKSKVLPLSLSNLKKYPRQFRTAPEFVNILMSRLITDHLSHLHTMASHSNLVAEGNIFNCLYLIYFMIMIDICIMIYTILVRYVKISLRNSLDV